MTTSTGRSGTISSLVSELASKDGVVRERARHALVAMGKPATKALIKALSSRRDEVRWEAAKAFQEAPNVAAVPTLVATLEDEESSIRWLAAEALTALGTDALGALLEALIAKPKSRRLQEAAHHVLRAEPGKKLRRTLAPVLKAIEDIEPQEAIPVAAEQVLAELRDRGR